MIVCIATGHIAWECPDVLGPFTSEELARARCREIRDSYNPDDDTPYDTYRFEFWELDGLKQIGEGRLCKPEDL